MYSSYVFIIYIHQEGANVLFFTFINPATMDVPAAFQKLGNFFKCFWFKTQGQLKQLYVYLRYENDGKNDYLYLLSSAATRGTGVEGAVPADTLIIFAIGGWVHIMWSYCDLLWPALFQT